MNRTGIQDFADVAALRATTITPQDSDKVFVTSLGNQQFDWSAASTATDDGFNVIKQTTLATGRWVAVFGSGKKRVVNVTANYTTVAADGMNTMLAVNSATAVTITLSNLTDGQSLQVFQTGAGQITFASGTLTARNVFSLVKSAGQWSAVEVSVVGTNATLSGALAA